MPSRGWRVSKLVLVGALVTLASAAAQDPEARKANDDEPRAAAPAAAMQVSSSAVNWLPAEDHEGLALTVSGPDGVWVRQEFGPPDLPTFGLFDAQGQRYPDGSYTYELRTTDRLLVSGSFEIREGSFIEPATDPGPRTTLPAGGGLRSITAAAQTINDDLVVDGTACIGFSCLVDGDEGSFADGVRLKGDGLGILFEDVYGGTTSERDWIVRTGAIGTDNFEIVDLGEGQIDVPFSIQGGAPSDALVLLANGDVLMPNASTRLGIGTGSPGAKLHLFSGQTTDVFVSAGPDPLNGPAFNFGYGGASFGRGAAYLNVRPDASATAPNPSLRFLTANAQRVIIDNEGNIGFGSNVAGFNPAHPLVHQSSNARLEGGIWTNGSSRAIKHDIHALEASEAMAAFAQLEPVRYRANESPNEVVLGFIAEDVPELVAYNDRKSLSPMEMVAVLTKVVQEQQKTITELAAKVEELKEKK